MKIKTIPKGNFVSVIQTLNKFDETIENFYKKAKDTNKSIKDCGYLIEKSVLDNLKTKLSYDELNDKKDHKSLQKQINKVFKNAESINFKTGEEIIFSNYKELEEDLKQNNSEYIIVDATIWKIINNGPVKIFEKNLSYEINSKNLIINLKNNEQVFFEHNKNIINYQCLLKNESNKNINDIKKVEDSNEIKKMR